MSIERRPITLASVSRRVEVKAAVIRGSERDPTKSKKKGTFLKMRTGQEPSVTLGRNVERSMVINRRDYRYQGRVVDPATDEVLHQCDEPLKKHQGHGSAKRRFKF